MKKFLFIFVCFLAAVFLGCVVSDSGDTANTGSLTLMTWNLHNLFDGKDDGYEYKEFLQSSGWTVEKYLGRINSFSAAISSLNTLPDIILFQEIESFQVLEDLALAFPKGYSWIHFANNPNTIGLGILSRLPLLDTKAHSININGETTPRPVLEARVQTNNGDFIIFACHWKSKIGGDDATEDVRMASARTIVRRIRELWEKEPEMGIIVAGDLNESYDDYYRRGSHRLYALLPDDPHCVKLAFSGQSNEQKDFFVITGNKPPEPVYFPENTIILFSPWVNELENGSYFYRNNWETIDHFLISRQFFTNSGWEYCRTIVADFEPFVNQKGVPAPYNPRTGNGLSDHLPLLLTLRIR